MLFKPVKKWPWTFEAVPVWPDARLKSSSIFTKVSQKKPKLFLHLKRGFRKAHKVAQCLGYFCKRICLQDFSKVAQSDYTVQFVPNGDQCDQIGQFITIWATFQSSWQQLFCHKSPTFLGNFCNGVKIFNFTSKILFWQLLWTLGDFLLVTLPVADTRSLFLISLAPAFNVKCVQKKFFLVKKTQKERTKLFRL